MKVGARVLISKNIDIADRLVNGQVGTVMRFKFHCNNKISGFYVKLDDVTAGKKGSNFDSVCRENNWTLIERAESTFATRKNKQKSTMVRRTQFPLILSYACTRSQSPRANTSISSRYRSTFNVPPDCPTLTS
eukprot:TCONS_00022004-protein